MTKPKPWVTQRSKPAGDFRIFTIRQDFKASPRTGSNHDFYVIDCVDWVNVVPVTPDGKHLVMVEQFRHGSGTVELEVPGGVMDSDDRTPEETAVRELREETGYEGKNARIIGEVYPNPAIMSNRCHTVLVDQCAPRHRTEFDHGEDLVTRLVPVSEIRTMIGDHKIRHSLVIVALLHFELARARGSHR